MRGGSSNRPIRRHSRTWPRWLKEEVIEMVSSGMKQSEVSARTGIPESTIKTILHRARRRGVRVPDGRIKAERSCRKHLVVPARVAAAFEIEAEARGIENSSLLMNRLLAIVADERNLIDAILDGERP